MTTLSIINTSFAGIHKWDNAPDEVWFLRSPHRHEFKVQVAVTVPHNPTTDHRDVEYILFKNAVNNLIGMLYDRDITNGVYIVGGRSCEMIAKELAEALVQKAFSISYVEVFEDGENGARFIPDSEA
jgi:hypothetical protein